MKRIINKYLRKFGVELHGLGYLQSLAKGEFTKDAFEVQKDLSTGKNIRTIFDVGANRGDVTGRYRELFPDAVIYAFEPFPLSFETLRDRYGRFASVRCEPVGLSDKEETRQFYVNRNVDTNSLLKPAKTGLSSDAQVANESVIDIRTTTIDIYCKANNIAQIDILKLDIQGGELAALKGAAGLLAEKRIGLIYSEVYFLEQYEAHPLFHEISRFLHSHGYYLQDIYSPIYGAGSLAWADAIFLRHP